MLSAERASKGGQARLLLGVTLLLAWPAQSGGQVPGPVPGVPGQAPLFNPMGAAFPAAGLTPFGGGFGGMPAGFPGLWAGYSTGLPAAGPFYPMIPDPLWGYPVSGFGFPAAGLGVPVAGYGFAGVFPPGGGYGMQVSGIPVGLSFAGAPGLGFGGLGGLARPGNPAPGFGNVPGMPAGAGFAGKVPGGFNGGRGL